MNFKFLQSLQNLDSVPAVLRGLYGEADEGFELKEEAKGLLGHSIEDVTGLRNTVQATRKERDDALGEIKDLKAQIASLQAGGGGDGGKGGGKPDAAELQTLTARAEKAETDRDTWRDRFVQGERKRAIEAAIRQDHPKNPVALFYSVVDEALGHEITDEGNVRVFIKAEGGGRRITSKPGESGDMTPAEYVSDILRNRDDLKPHFPAKEQGGSGGGGSDDKGRGGKPTSNPWDPKAPNYTAQAMMEDENPALAGRLKAEAGVA